MVFFFLKQVLIVWQYLFLINNIFMKLYEINHS